MVSCAAAQPIVLPLKVVAPYVAVLVSRLDVNPVDTRPPSVGAAGHEAHTEVDVAHVVDENEPAGQKSVQAAVISPVVAPYVPAGQQVHADVVAPAME